MISWMQRHNRYLVWTIWIATIAFIGAGFVGWGSYNLASKAGSVAKVGDIEIKQTKLNMVYSNLYNRYNQMLEGKLDEEKAKSMGLVKQAFSTLAIQAKILNFAKEIGIVVSDHEVIEKLQEMQAFQKEGKFNVEIYHNYLKAQRLKAKDFEETLKEEMLIEKTLALFETQVFPLEINVTQATLAYADKLAYKVLAQNDINYTRDEKSLYAFWETQKENYLTDKRYTLQLLRTPSSDANITEEEMKQYYKANSFNYTDDSGKPLSFTEAKEEVGKDLKLKKTKKRAQKAYIKFKKGAIKESETLSLNMGDPKLTQTIWRALQNKKTGDILKPKIMEDQYITVKIKQIDKPRIMTFEEAKERVAKVYDKREKKKYLHALAKKTLNTLDENNATLSDFINLNHSDNIKSLNAQESLQFLEKLFTSNKEKGIISISDKVIVYKILAQKQLPMDENKTANVKQTVNRIKKRVFESNLFDFLDKKYPTKVYMEGLTN